MSEYIAIKELECFGCRRVIRESEKFYIAYNLIYRKPRLLWEEWHKKSSKYEILIVRMKWIYRKIGNKFLSFTFFLNLYLRRGILKSKILEN